MICFVSYLMTYYFIFMKYLVVTTIATQSQTKLTKSATYGERLLATSVAISLQAIPELRMTVGNNSEDMR